ncbi:hypothetical protein KSS87_009421, partial [Heliosperma pusillum]
WLCVTLVIFSVALNIFSVILFSSHFLTTIIVQSEIGRRMILCHFRYIFRHFRHIFCHYILSFFSAIVVKDEIGCCIIYCHFRYIFRHFMHIFF